MRYLGKRHIIQWTIDAWTEAGFDAKDLILSSENVYIRNYASHHLGMVIDQGPRTDDPAKVIKQALSAFGSADVIVYLQPTTPFKKPEHIKRAAYLVGTGSYNSCFTGMRIPERFHPYNVFDLAPEGYAQKINRAFTPKRQSLPDLYSRDGGVYAVSVEAFRKSKDLYAHSCAIIETDPIDYCNIDTEEDWLEAEWRAAEIERSYAVEREADEVGARSNSRVSPNWNSEGL